MKTAPLQSREQYEQGFITEEERYRLTVENWTKIDARVQDMLAEQMVGQEIDHVYRGYLWCSW